MKKTALPTFPAPVVLQPVDTELLNWIQSNNRACKRSEIVTHASVGLGLSQGQTETCLKRLVAFGSLHQVKTIASASTSNNKVDPDPEFCLV